MNRRSFLKAIGLAPGALMVGASAEPCSMEFMGRKILYSNSFDEPRKMCFSGELFDIQIWDDVIPSRMITQYQARIMFPKMPE